MTMTDPYARIDAVLAEATPGPWTVHQVEGVADDWWSVDAAARSEGIALTDEDDARFIALARNILPAALDVVKAAAYLRSVENDPESSLAVKPARLLLDERLAAFHRIEEEQT